jgi:DNA-binding XRE family transcriptional regulator
VDLEHLASWKLSVTSSRRIPNGPRPSNCLTMSPQMSRFRLAKRRTAVSVGESVRIIRELQELSQNQLAQLTGIPQATISAIENDRVSPGVERANVLARALKCHPAALVFLG